MWTPPTTSSLQGEAQHSLLLLRACMEKAQRVSFPNNHHNYIVGNQPETTEMLLAAGLHRLSRRLPTAGRRLVASRWLPASTGHHEPTSQGPSPIPLQPQTGQRILSCSTFKTNTVTPTRKQCSLRSACGQGSLVSYLRASGEGTSDQHKQHGVVTHESR